MVRIVKLISCFRIFSLYGIAVQFVVDLYRGDRFVPATNRKVKMCIYSSIDYVLDLNLSISVSS